MIIPTVGRVVWFRPAIYDVAGMTVFDGQPLKADVAYVWDDRTVNLRITDHAGIAHVRTKVPLRQDGDPEPQGQSYCEWMPYQKQVARGEIKPTQHAAGTPHISTTGTAVDNH